MWHSNVADGSPELNENEAEFAVVSTGGADVMLTEGGVLSIVHV